ncbi:DUF4270 family protein [uncultured Alistipes sp.]|uniref:DUF4270 family protein n=1 Tax=uncultured Alistipes sp. TaxID=538949 RepID=UPI0028061AE2|nr:DUF4270 family protein [uncultured Alistipes sp.]
MKRFNNSRRSLRRALVVLAGAFALGSCTMVDDTLGGNLIPDNQQMKAGVVTIDGLNPKKYVETRLFQTDSISSANISYGYFGAQINDTLGERKAGFLSQMVSYYSVPQDYFGYMPIFDSAQLLLNVTSFGRDTVTEQHFAVYAILNNDYITERESSDTVFYLNFKPDASIYNQNEPLFTFTLGGEGKYPSTTTAVTMTPTDAGRKYINRLMLQEGKYKDDYSIYSTDSLEYFIEEFPGLYIAPDPAYPLAKEGSNTGTIFGTSLDASGLSIYCRNRVKEDPSLIKDTVGMLFYFYDSYAKHGNVSVNSISHDYSKATVLAFNEEDAREPAAGTGDTRQPVTQLRVEGMGGAVTEMTLTPGFFATLEEVIARENAREGRDFQSMAFSQARMSVYFSGSSYDWSEINPNPSGEGSVSPLMPLIEEMNAAPNRLGLYTNYKKLTPVTDYAYTYEKTYSTELDYGGYINRSRGCYVLLVTGYMQGVWNSYLDAKHAAGAEYPDPALEESDPAGFEAAYKAWEEAIDWSKVKNRTVYIGPEAYSLYTTSFGVFQGAPTETEAVESPIRFDLAYNLIK